MEKVAGSCRVCTHNSLTWKEKECHSVRISKQMRQLYFSLPSCKSRKSSRVTFLFVSEFLLILDRFCVKMAARFIPPEIQVCTLHSANLQPRVFLASKRLILALKMLTFFTIEWPTGLSRKAVPILGMLSSGFFSIDFVASSWTECPDLEFWPKFCGIWKFHRG